MRQNEVRRVRNKVRKTRMRNAIKELNKLIEGNQVAEAQAKLPEILGIIDRTASKGIIHKKQADRRKSRLTLKVNALNA